MSSRRHLRCLIGGTFDRFHLGHEILLDAALEAAERVEVWVTDDEMAQRKSSIIQDHATRCEHLLEWARAHHPGRMTVHQLEDEMGPAPIRKDCDAIACTPETEAACRAINALPLGNELPPLEILLVPHLVDDEGEVLSSSRIRSGRTDRNGTTWLPGSVLACTHRFVSALDEELKRPHGMLYEGPESDPSVAMGAALNDRHRGGSLIVVGDVSVATCLALDVVPDVAIVDGMTKREHLSADQRPRIEGYPVKLHCENPPGLLTSDLKGTIVTAITSDRPVVIIVEGEEDLAPIIVHLAAPLGTTVLYGQPGVGVVLQQTTLEVKERCRRLLESFEVID